MRFAHGTAGYFWDVGYVTSGLGNYLQFYNSDGATAGTRMVIKYGGNVGIGTTGPAAKLEIANPSDIGIKITATTDHLVFANNISSNKWTQYLSGNDLRFYDTADRVTV